MRSVEVVERFPGAQLLVQIDIIRVGQHLVELLLIRPVRSLDLSVQLGRPGLDVHMPDALVLDVPVEQGLPFMPSVSSYGVDTEGELLDDVINEVDRVLLRMASVDLQCPDPGRIVDRGVLIPTDSVAVICGQVVRNLTSNCMWCPGTRLA